MLVCIYILAAIGSLIGICAVFLFNMLDDEPRLDADLREVLRNSANRDDSESLKRSFRKIAACAAMFSFAFQYVSIILFYFYIN